MLDFRYHALSLAAVLVALILGLLLGVAIGDEGLVSSAENDLRRDLRADVREANEESARLREEIDRRRRYEDATFAPLVAGRLDGRRVTLLFLDERSEPVFQHVREAIAPAGGELEFTATLRLPVDVPAIVEAASGTQYEGLADDTGLLDDLGRRVGVQLARSGRLLRTLREPLLASSSGELGPAEAVVVVRTPGERIDDPEQRRLRNALVDGILEGLRRARVPVVGVEETSTEPSQVPWYRDHGVASVDNVDDVAGRASLVYALAGSADGAYGVKSTRDALIPDALVRGP
jgi:hypothetical protein